MVLGGRSGVGEGVLYECVFIRRQNDPLKELKGLSIRGTVCLLTFRGRDRERILCIS